MPNNQGFTLVEVLVSIIILAIGILAWISSLEQNTKSRTISSELTKATELMQSKMEVLSSEVSEWNDDHSSLQNCSSNTLDSINYFLCWKVISGGEFVTGGKSSWLISVNATWQHYGNRTISMEKVILGI